MNYKMTPDERETIVRTDEGDPWVWISTYHQPTCRRLREDGRFTIIKDEDGQVQAKLPKKDWNPLGFAKSRRNLTPEQRAAVAKRMQKARVTK